MKALIIGVSMLFLSACISSEKDDLSLYIKDTKAKTIRFAENANPPKLLLTGEGEKSTYQVDSLQRGPFMSWVVAPQRVLKQSSGGPRPDEKRQKEFLESYPLDSLKLMGTFKISGEEIALIRAPDGVVHRVKKGAYMGANYGKVLDITKASMSLKEFVADGLGGWRIRTTLLSMKE